MRKFFLLLLAVARIANQVRGVRGRGRHRRHNFLAFQAGKLLRHLLKGGR